MLVREQLIVDQAVGGRVNELHSQAADLADLLGDPGRQGYLLPEEAGLAVAAGDERRWPVDQVAGVEIAQGLEAGDLPGSAGRRVEAEVAADAIGQGGAMRDRLGVHQGRETLEALRQKNVEKIRRCACIPPLGTIHYSIVRYPVLETPKTSGQSADCPKACPGRARPGA